MKKYLNIRAILSILMSCVLIFSIVLSIVPARAETMASQQFAADGVKFQPAGTAPESKCFSDSRRGLVMRAYDSGASASFRKLYHGVFEAELKASTKDTTVPDLGAWSLAFTDVFTQESFRLTVEDKGTEQQAYISVGEDMTGIYYNVDNIYDNKAHGYTTLQNQAGKYTRVITQKTTKVRFDPTTMEVSLQDDAGNQILVWDLSQEIMDGKRFSHVIDSMDSYYVTLEFTKVRAGGRGELTLYSVCGESFSNACMPAPEASVYANVTAYPVAGQVYTLPVPGIFDAEGKLSVSDIAYTVYDENGTVVAEGAYTENAAFTPEAPGSYYVYYVLKSGDTKGDTYVKLQALSQEQVTAQFSENTLTGGEYGLNTILEIPVCSFDSNLFAEGHEEEALVTISKDGTVLGNYHAVPAGFTYTFDALGTYQIVYSASLAGNTYEAEPVQIVISEEIPGVVCEAISESLFVGDICNIPEMTVYLGGNSGKANHIVQLPDGSQVTDSSLTLSSIGSYTVIYSYDVAGVQGTVVRSFQVNRKTTDMFTAVGKAEVNYEANLPNANLPGVMVTISDSNAYVTCDVDLSDNTKNDNLIDLMVVANTLGVVDCTGFYVTLTDKLNPENYVTIRVHQGSGNATNGSFVKAKASNQVAYTGWYKSPDWNGGSPYTYTNQLETAMAHNFGGFLTSHSFSTSSLSNDLEKYYVRLYWDAEEKALYASNDMEYKAMPDKNEMLVVDFDDPACFTNLWSGFTDNSQVELKISPVTVSGSVNIKILQVDGKKLDSETVQDTQGPSLALDMDGMTAIPDAATGKPYRVLGLHANDDLSTEELIHTNITVTYNGREVEVTDGTFTPTADGIYTVTYTASDAYGNTSVLTAPVRSRSNISAVSATLTGTWQETAEYGFPIVFPAYQGAGGSGRYYYSAQVTHNGVTEDVTGSSYTPMEEGSYTITLTVKDYLGQEASLTHSYDVTYRPVFVVDESKFILPPAFIDGSTYTFDLYTQGIYQAVGADISAVTAKIEVEDAQGIYTLDSSRNYTPKSSDTVNSAKIRFIFEATIGGETVRSVVEKSAPIRMISKDAGFMTDYFLMENAEAEARNQFITFRSTGKDSVLTFLRPISVDVFSLEWKPATADNKFLSNYNAIRVTLTDRSDPSVVLEMTVTKNNDGLLFSANGSTPMVMLGSLTAESALNIQLSYNNHTFALSGVENSSLGNVKQTLSGEEFKGFPSGEAFMTVELVGVKGTSALNLIAINNQRLFNTVKDTGTPQLYVDGSYSGMYTAGTEITLPSARAYDVLNYTSPATIKVIAPDGTAVTAADGTVLDGAPADKTYVITPEILGRYTVSYQSTDQAGQYISAEKSMVIYDDIAPTVELSNALPERVWVGTTIQVPQYTVIDNGDSSKVTVDIFYRDAQGTIHNVTDNQFTANQAGTYVLMFYMVDENGTYNTQSFEILAVAREGK